MDSEESYDDDVESSSDEESDQSSDSADDEASRMKSKKEDFDIAACLVKVTMSKYKDPVSAWEDMKDRFLRRALKVALIGSTVAIIFAAMAKIRHDADRLRTKGQPLVRWVPAKEQNHWLVPSLLDMSMSVLVKNAECLSSLDGVPDKMREKITNLVCDYRKMDVNFMRVLLDGSPEEISVKDCSWMTTNQVIEIFGKRDLKNLKVLRLDLCGKFMFDFSLRDAFAWSSIGFDALAVLSLKGAIGLSDNGLSDLTQLVPSLKSINLSQCSLITAHGINILANSYIFTLMELFIDECPMIDAMLILPALTELESLEVLSVAGIPTVTDEFVGQIAEAFRKNLKELKLANCKNLTDNAMSVLRTWCPNITTLDISNLDKFSDFSLGYIAYGCRSIYHLKLLRNDFSDEAVGAFLELTGHSLTELSLNCIPEVGPCTALSIARFATNLETLDLSWCRNLSDEMVGNIVDSCKSLKLLKLFGCTQITEVFLKGHSNRIVRIVGVKNLLVPDTDAFTN